MPPKPPESQRIVFEVRKRFVPAWAHELVASGVPEEEWIPPDDPRMGGVRLVYVDQLWFETPAWPGWIAAYRFALQDGVPVVAELRLFPDETPPDTPADQRWSDEVRWTYRGRWSDEARWSRWSGEYRATAAVPPGGVQARMLRTLPVGRHLAMLRKRFREWAEHYSTRDRTAPGTIEAEDLTLFRMADVFGVTPRTLRQVPQPAGRRGWPESVYAQVAVTYAQAFAGGERHPTAAVARKMRVKPSQARDLVKGARKRGLLTRARRSGEPTEKAQGRPGGELTEKAQALLGLDARGRGAAARAKPKRARRTTRGGK